LSVLNCPPIRVKAGLSEAAANTAIAPAERDGPEADLTPHPSGAADT
jgi:hypothetical protein